MKTILMMATAFMLSLTANANVNPEEVEKTTSETTTMTLTLAELKEIYGAENIDVSALGEISEQTLISFTTKAGPPCHGETPCGAALAQARHQAQLQANACCCVQISGVECCNQGNLMAILFIVEPNSAFCP